MSAFRLQVVYADGTVLPWVPGGAFERDLIANCTAAIVKRGIGLWKTEAHVRADIEAGMTEVLLDLKRDVRPLVVRQ